MNVVQYCRAYRPPDHDWGHESVYPYPMTPLAYSARKLLLSGRQWKLAPQWHGVCMLQTAIGQCDQKGNNAAICLYTLISEPCPLAYAAAAATARLAAASAVLSVWISQVDGHWSVTLL